MLAPVLLALVAALVGLPPGAGPVSSPTWAEIAVGEPPRVPYVARSGYVTPDGPVAIPLGRGIGAVVPYRDGFLYSDTSYFEGTSGLHLVADGRRVASWPRYGYCHSGFPFASPDGTTVAWMTLRCPESLDRTRPAVFLANRDGTCVHRQRLRGEPYQLASVVGFVGEEVVYSGSRGAWVTDLTSPARRIPGLAAARATAPRAGLVLGGRRVVEPDGTTRWTSRFDLRSFSPRETRVLAVDGPRAVSLLAADDGRVVARIELPAGTESWGVSWETERTLLATMRREGGTALVRVYADGRVERVTPVLRSAGRRPAYATLPAG